MDFFRKGGWSRMKGTFLGYKGNTRLAFGSCCLSCLGWAWRCYCIFLIFVCLYHKKSCFQSLGWIEFKIKTKSERKSAMSSLNPSIIRICSFKCKAGVPLSEGNLFCAHLNIFYMQYSVWGELKGLVAPPPLPPSLPSLHPSTCWGL